MSSFVAVWERSLTALPKLRLELFIAEFRLYIYIPNCLRIHDAATNGERECKLLSMFFPRVFKLCFAHCVGSVASLSFRSLFVFLEFARSCDKYRD